MHVFFAASPSLSRLLVVTALVASVCVPFLADAALTRTTRGSASGGSSASGGDLTTASFTPSDNSLLVAVYGGLREANVAADATAGMSGGGLTWTKQATRNETNQGWRVWITIWTAPVATGASMTVAATNNNQMNGTFLAVHEYTGYNTASPIGGTASTSRTGTQGVWSFALSSAPAATSETVAGIVVDNWVDAAAGQVTAGTGWSETHDYPGIGTETTGEIQIRSASTSAAVQWQQADADVGDALNGQAAAVAIEIKAADVGRVIRLKGGIRLRGIRLR